MSHPAQKNTSQIPMIFQIPITPLVTVVLFFVVISGLTFLALRRRDALLEEFLVPEPNKESDREFLDRLGVVLEQLPPEPVEETPATEEDENVAWAADIPAWVNQQQIAPASEPNNGTP
ncbi:MAG: hypothetical protein ACRC46_13690 [Thermoguttaceae bacterium]